MAELKVWEIGATAHYPAGIKYSLFFVQPESGTVLFGMDNHKPKGPTCMLAGVRNRTISRRQRILSRIFGGLPQRKDTSYEIEEGPYLHSAHR